MEVQDGGIGVEEEFVQSCTYEHATVHMANPKPT